MISQVISLHNAIRNNTNKDDDSGEFYRSLSTRTSSAVTQVQEAAYIMTGNLLVELNILQAKM